MSGSSFIVMLVHTHADAGSVCLLPQWICIQTRTCDEITYQTCCCQVLHRCVFVLNFPLRGSDIFTVIINFTVIAASLCYSLM